MKITPSEIANWRENETTRKIFQYFLDSRELYKEELAEGTYTFADVGATAQKIGEMIGTCKAYKNILEISYDDFEAMYELTKEEEDDLK